ncbi:unnamed protein product [Rhizophagus irregularis]|nr:unnamed protein product [Rhizophagus irregularis]
MEILNKTSKEKPRNLWKDVDWDKYQIHVTVSSINSATKSEEIDDSVIYMDDIEKRKEVYEPVNSSDLSSFQVNSDDVPSVSTNLISECFDVQLSESDLNEINQEDDNLNET